QAAQAPQQAGDFAAALKALDAPPPADLRDDAELQRSVQQLRDGVVAAARERLTGMIRAVERATEAKDEAALGKAIDALAAAPANPARWPAELKQDLTIAANAVATARTAAEQLAA